MIITYQLLFVVLNNFTTRLGHRVGRLIQSLFPQDPEFRGRRVVTFHNQRDFIFFRHHRYIFETRENKQIVASKKKDDNEDGKEEDDNGDKEKTQKLKVIARLKECGPRFTLKLTSLQHGTFDTKGGEYEWVHKPEMDTSRIRDNIAVLGSKGDNISVLEWDIIAVLCSKGDNISVLDVRDLLGEGASRSTAVEEGEPSSHRNHSHNNDRHGSDRRCGGDNHRSSNNNYSGNNNRNSGNGRDQGNRGQQSNRPVNYDFQQSRGPSEGYSYPVCTTCRCRHPGECRRAAGTCFKCGQTGHLQKDCKKNTAASTSGQADKKPGASGRVFTITEDHDTKTSGTITGTLFIYVHAVFVLFDTSATHSVISSVFASYVTTTPTLLDHVLCISTPMKNSVFLRLAGFLGAAAGTEEEQAKNFQWGLRRSTLNHLMCMSYPDVAQIANVARNYEILHERDDDDTERPDKQQMSGARRHPTSQQSSYRVTVIITTVMNLTGEVVVTTTAAATTTTLAVTTS
uniref:Ribosome production factor 1 n=1 Tax=Tanacetum cinerariifolium TaxID=118510 RepID=A0A6L2JXT6_TANCI|nr:ribosome production factor 1 [Tanacetum cinerariifolium]